MHEQATATSAVQVEVEGGIGTLTIDRPQVLNALNAAVLSELERAIARLAGDPAVLGVIVTGAGPKAFVAGADISELERLDGAAGYRAARFGQGVFRQLEQMPKPSIAAVNGYALGGGLELALACTLRIASDTAKLGLPEVGLGIIPGYGGTQRLARLVGKARAIELMATGQLISFDEAKALGIVHHVWGEQELKGRSFRDAALDYARQFTPPAKASRAVGRMKRAVQSGTESGFLEGLSLERELQQLLFQAEDAKEGLAAHLEKRKPNFTGR